MFLPRLVNTHTPAYLEKKTGRNKQSDDDDDDDDVNKKFGIRTGRRDIRSSAFSDKAERRQKEKRTAQFRQSVYVCSGGPIILPEGYTHPESFLSPPIYFYSDIIRFADIFT